MNAEPLLARIARALSDVRLGVVLIGNAAAALQGAPVTTLDFDFCYRATPVNERKIRAFSRKLEASVSKPGDPVSQAIRVERAEDGMQVDFLPDDAIGAKFASLRARSVRVRLGEHTVCVADLSDVAEGKRRAGRPKDRASLYVIEATLDEKRRQQRED